MSRIITIGKKSVRHHILKLIVAKSRINRPLTTKLVVALHIDTVTIDLLLLIEHEAAQHALIVVKPPSIIVLALDIKSKNQFQSAGTKLSQAVLSTDAVKEPLEIDRPTANKWQSVSEITPDVIVSQE